MEIMRKSWQREHGAADQIASALKKQKVIEAATPLTRTPAQRMVPTTFRVFSIS